MDGYDQLWSLVEADEADLVPGLADTLIHAIGGGDLLSSEVLVDLSALESLPDTAPYAADFLTGSAGGDDFFPIHAFTTAPTTDSLPGIDPSAGEPLVLPAAANDVFDIPEPLVLPGVMDDGFVLSGDDDGRLVLPGSDDPFRMEDLPGERFLGHHAAGGVVFDMPIDHTLVVDDHGLIGAHGTDDWLF